MFNRTEYGLHHPGNVVPCCKPCNKRARREDKSYRTWFEHLESVCHKRGEADRFQERRDRIEKSIADEGYPDLNENERHSIRVIVNSLYENIKNELEKSIDLYKQLDEAFVQTDA